MKNKFYMWGLMEIIAILYSGCGTLKILRLPDSDYIYIDDWSWMVPLTDEAQEIIPILNDLGASFAWVVPEASISLQDFEVSTTYWEGNTNLLSCMFFYTVYGVNFHSTFSISLCKTTDDMWAIDSSPREKFKMDYEELKNNMFSQQCMGRFCEAENALLLEAELSQQRAFARSVFPEFEAYLPKMTHRIGQGYTNNWMKFCWADIFPVILDSLARHLAVEKIGQDDARLYRLFLAGTQEDDTTYLKIYFVRKTITDVSQDDFYIVAARRQGCPYTLEFSSSPNILGEARAGLKITNKNVKDKAGQWTTPMATQ